MKKTIFIAGGGTGGHIYPGVAIAEAIKRRDPEVVVHFVGTSAGLEVEIMKREQLPLHELPIGKLNFSGRYFQKIKTLVKMPVAIFKSMLLLWHFKPIFVLGVGGYASGPFVLTAATLGFNTGIWEPNAMPGLANRWLSRFVDIGFIVFDKAAQFLKCSNLQNLGMPIRSQMEARTSELTSAESTESAGSPVKMDSQHQTSEIKILVFGGSQGARAINATVFELIKNYSHELHNLNIKWVHQTGKWDWAQAQELYQNQNYCVEAHEFIFDMPSFYRSSDIAICRAGASSLAELSAFGLVPILIPLPLADGHQEANATELARAGAALVVPQSELSSDRLMKELRKLIQDHKLRNQMSQKLRGLHKVGAADRIAQTIFEQVKL